MNESINARQSGVLCLISILANKFLLLPSLMFQQSKSDAIFAMLILFAFDIFMLFIFFKVKRTFPKDSLFAILSKKLSKTIAILVYTIFVVYFLIKSLLTVDVVYAYLKQQVYQGEFFALAIISIVPVVNHAVMKGIRVISRTMEIFFILICIGFVSCLAFSMFTQLSFPVLFTAPIKSILSSVYKNAFSFGDFIFLFLIIDKINIKKGEEKLILKYALIGVFLILSLFFLYYSKYEVTSFMHNNALSDILVFSVRFNAIGRLDIISMLTIMFLTTFELELFCFGFCESAQKIFPLMSRAAVILFFDIVAPLAYFLYFGKYEQIINDFSTWLVYFAIFVNYIFPLICLIITFFESKKLIKIYKKNNFILNGEKIERKNKKNM